MSLTSASTSHSKPAIHLGSVTSAKTAASKRCDPSSGS